MKKNLTGEICLLLAALFWGGAFVAQSLGSDNIGCMTFNAARSFIGSLVLTPVILISDRVLGKQPPRGKERKMLWLGGLVCGFFLTFAVNLQQFGIAFVDTGLSEAEAALAEKANVGKVGFLTALYIVIVPILGLFLKKKAPPTVYIAVLIALAGMYLLCVKADFTIGQGDISVIACAFMFSLQIMSVDYFAARVDCIRLSCLQFLVCGILSAVGMLLWESLDIEAVLNAWAPILYTGIMSSGAAYTLQILGQKRTKPAVASLIMSLESVFSAVFGFLILHQTLSLREILGCALMMTAVLLAQFQKKSA